MRKVTLFAVLLLIVATLAAEMIARLPQVVNPLGIALTQDRIYIVDDPATVHMYARRPGGIEFVKSFGREGDAPGEFMEIFRCSRSWITWRSLSTARSRTSPWTAGFRDELKLPIRFWRKKPLRAR